jgi:DNA-binding beta-propeller fold protein YncE
MRATRFRPSHGHRDGVHGVPVPGSRGEPGGLPTPASRRVPSRPAATLLIAGAVLVLSTAAALAVTGDLTQPAGTAGCISETGAGPCADGHALNGANAVAVSADGKSVYAASQDSDAVVRLSRNTTTGAIAQPAGSAGCISETGAGPCADGHALAGPFGVAVSADGKSVYAVSRDSNAVARFTRNTTTGAITQPTGSAGCISETGAGPCADGHGLSGANSVAVSADGKSVYVTSLTGVARLTRDPTTGAITQPAGTAGCISETGAGPCADGHALSDGADSVRVSADGKSVYVASFPNNAVLRLNRNTTSGAITQPAGAAGCISETGAGPCADGHGLTGAAWIAVSPDGKSVYAAANTGKAIARLNRDTTTGAITQPAGTAGCISETGAGPCADGHGLSGPVWVTVSPDGKNVYAAAHFSNAVVRLNRNTTSGAITQPAGSAGCISETGAGPCADGHGLSLAFSVEVSADGKSVYVASLLSDAVARFIRTP